MKKRRIGIYGGKFDPPHLGHLLCAEMTREAFALDKVLFVTSAVPPHKDSGVTDARIRHEMVEAACAPNCFFEACDIELKREGKSFTLLTVRQLREIYGPDTELCLMISSEYLDPDYEWNVGRWTGSDELLKMVRLLVFTRQGHTNELSRAWGALLQEKFAASFAVQIDYLDFCPSPPTSSTLLRERVSKQLSIWYMVLPEVWDIIRVRCLYGCKTPPRGSDLRKGWRRLTVSAKRYWNRLLRRLR